METKEDHTVEIWMTIIVIILFVIAPIISLASEPANENYSPDAEIMCNYGTGPEGC